MPRQRDFFARDARSVARDLIGVELIRKLGRKKLRGIITETEAYHGFSDRASHASRGMTKRNAPMFDEPGTIYVYLVYGMHYCVNIVTMRHGFPAAVLIRGVLVPETGIAVNGPGRVSRYFKITKSLNGKDIYASNLSVGRRRINPPRILRKPRVGVGYAGEWSKKRWRYLIQL